MSKPPSEASSPVLPNIAFAFCFSFSFPAIYFSPSCAGFGKGASRPWMKSRNVGASLGFCSNDFQELKSPENDAPRIR